MMFTTSFEQLKCDALSYLPELPSGVHFRVISLKLHSCHSNLSNPLSMSRASLQCINLIMHTCCALHCAMVDCCFSLPGVLFPPLDRNSEVKINSSRGQILDPNGQVKSCFEAILWFSIPGKHNLLSAHICFPSVFRNLVNAYDSKISCVSSIVILYFA